MEEKRDLGELLHEALTAIEDAGGPERHQLRELVGKKVYDAMMAKQRTSDLISRWLSAGPKTKVAATRALAIGIARHADKPELVARIEREIGDTFDIEQPRNVAKSRETQKREPTPAETKKHRQAVNQRRNDHRPPGYKPPKGVDLAMLAAGNDMSRYIKARRD